MNNIVKALNGLKTESLPYYESVRFAFKTKPTSFGEYLKMSLDYGEKYSMDAVPLSLQIDEKVIHPEAALGELAKVERKVGIGLTYIAPFTATAKKVGIEPFLLGLTEGQEMKAEITENALRMVDVLKRFEDYVDFFILIDPVVCNDMISPSYFKEYVSSTYKTMLEATELPLIIHMPGKILNNLPHLIESGVDGVQPIDKDDLSEVVSIANGNLSIVGNLNGRLLINGTHKEIEADFERCLKAHNYTKDWIVHTNFWIPVESKPEKIQYLSTLVRSVR